jgi:hypothetical protein
MALYKNCNLEGAIRFLQSCTCERLDGLHYECQRAMDRNGIKPAGRKEATRVELKANERPSGSIRGILDFVLSVSPPPTEGTTDAMKKEHAEACDKIKQIDCCVRRTFDFHGYSPKEEAAE